MISRRFVVAASLVAVTGCIPAYVAPTRDDAAHLRLVPQGKLQFSMITFANGKECRTRQNLLGSATAKLKEKTDVRIPPDEEFTLLAAYNDASSKCNVAVSFLPKPRELYTAVVEGNYGGCKLAILRANGASYVAEPTARKRKWSMPFWSNDEAQCKE